MKEVNVNVAELLEKLKENRTKHRGIFKDAQKGYRAEAIKQLDIALADAKAGKSINTEIYLEKPVDQTKDYDKAILMLEMHSEDYIDVSASDFSNYVMDDWSWKRNFIATNSMYTAITE